MRSSMPPKEGHPALVCPINLFERLEPQIADISSRINTAPTPHEKGQLANDLLGLTQQLLDCESSDSNNLNCRLCREFSALRQQTAKLVLKMSGAAGEDGT
jgi:hypothetical protein